MTFLSWSAAVAGRLKVGAVGGSAQRVGAPYYERLFATMIIDRTVDNQFPGGIKTFGWHGPAAGRTTADPMVAAGPPDGSGLLGGLPRDLAAEREAADHLVAGAGAADDAAVAAQLAGPPAGALGAGRGDQLDHRLGQRCGLRQPSQGQVRDQVAILEAQAGLAAGGGQRRREGDQRLELAGDTSPQHPSPARVREGPSAVELEVGGLGGGRGG